MRPMVRAVLIAVAVVLAVGTAPARAFEDRSAHLVIDAATGAVLSARKPNHTRFPASLTKMMTVMMLFRALEDGTVTPQTGIPFSQTAAAANPVKLGLPPGDSITVAEAIPALIARSANDVAVAVAEFLSGSEAQFARDMTRVARTELGMTRTTFRNASGLPDDGHVSTARDMARLALALWRDHARLFPAFGTAHFQFRGQALPTYNPLIDQYDGADGLKTGFTCAAGYNLAGTAVREGHRVIAVVMGAASSADRYATITGLMDAAFDRLADAQPAELEGAGVVPTSSGGAATAEPWSFHLDPGVPLTLASLTTPRPLRAVPAPDVEGCGGLYAGGWAITLGAFRSHARARSLATEAARIYGGKPLVWPVGVGGMVKHKPFVAGLSAGQARSICVRRQQAGQYCLVRSPQMMQAFRQSVARLRRSLQ